MIRYSLRLLLVSSLLAVPAHALDLGKLLTTENIESVGKILNNTVEANKTITPQQEIVMGQGVMATLLGAAPLVKDPALQKYVNQVGMWVAAQSEQPNLGWRFGVMDSPNINAFAAPGGYILITRGLWDHIRSEAELAAILGHEITHVLKKDQIEAIKSTNRGAIYEELLVLGVNNKVKGGGKELGRKAAKATTEGFYIKGLSKDAEYQADIGGMVLAARAGYNPYAMVSVLQTLGNVSPSDTAVALFFSTHPSPQDRLDQIDAKVGDQLEKYAEGVENTARFSKLKK
ncbi:MULTISPECIES: M48 family metalloprotease [Deefgea]|uniref:M48 family metalloprotease n=1 Tax=Deefgea chitinilytica TaxID=570276 RepID=A0ABS2CBD9_9NEIS|nr:MULTISPECIES: M48 family metalloprotease [Deefgea]MBM5571469.1 M48 family metalloprotease [Deefgea chitinilytica]MBM9888702.1 M48 family metalloprotease [Deefgea sp. CFH1-16]